MEADPLPTPHFVRLSDIGSPAPLSVVLRRPFGKAGERTMRRSYVYLRVAWWALLLALVELVIRSRTVRGASLLTALTLSAFLTGVVGTLRLTEPPRTARQVIAPQTQPSVTPWSIGCDPAPGTLMECRQYAPRCAAACDLCVIPITMTPAETEVPAPNCQVPFPDVIRSPWHVVPAISAREDAWGQHGGWVPEQQGHGWRSPLPLHSYSALPMVAPRGGSL
jgi:hypothetical protein